MSASFSCAQRSDVWLTKTLFGAYIRPEVRGDIWSSSRDWRHNLSQADAISSPNANTLCWIFNVWQQTESGFLFGLPLTQRVRRWGRALFRRRPWLRTFARRYRPHVWHWDIHSCAPLWSFGITCLTCCITSCTTATTALLLWLCLQINFELRYSTFKYSFQIFKFESRSYKFAWLCNATFLYNKRLESPSFSCQMMERKNKEVRPR